MWAATGRRYGPCETVVQPQPPRRPDPLYRTFGLGAGGGLLSPVIDAGQWYNRPYSGDGGLCCTTAHCEVELPSPTSKAQISAVTVAGVTVSSSAYVVFDGRTLVRTDGQCWPVCVNSAQQNPAAFTVALTVGLQIPDAVQAAFERLACEYASGCDGGECALPQRLTRLSRQGVDIEIEAVPAADPDGGSGGLLLTGIREVDDVIRAVNPRGIVAAPQVLTPDLPAPRRLT
jgi:hypothetical protein